MSRVLIVGNITKDVYLRLDDRQNKFEVDQEGVSWLDLKFDGSSHHFLMRHAVFGGAAVSLEVLSRFGLEAEIAGVRAEFLDGDVRVHSRADIYRYILSHGDDISYFSPGQAMPTRWVAPAAKVDWIYIDRSANVTRELANEVLKYLQAYPEVKLAFFASWRTNMADSAVRQVLERADLVFTDADTAFAVPVVRILDGVIEFEGQKIHSRMDVRQDLMTHLTTNLIIASSVLGALVLGKSTAEALLLAWANVEGSSLDHTLGIENLEELVVGEGFRVEKTNKTEDKMSEIQENARKLVAKGKGILAADESGGSIHKKFESMGISDDETHRRDYRNIFLSTPSLERYVNGVILFDETARQKADDGKDFVSYLRGRGVIPGIKVDQGLVNLEGSEEKYTQGLDGLPERLAEYYEMGLRFAKWRAAFEILEGTPSDMAIEKNAEILAQYATDCQAAGIVPIVEPEVVHNGDYSIEKCAEVTGRILDALFSALGAKKVDLSACILKVNMVLAGEKFAKQSTPEEVGRATAKVLREHVPEVLAGVVFLSGGQSVEQATENLQAVTNEGPYPWPVTFSFARALQDPALEAWKGDNANVTAAQKAFLARLIKNADALSKQ